jgi:butyrate kinase
MNRNAPLILCINPGSTSTKVAVFQGEAGLFLEEISHPKAVFAACGTVQDQLALRRDAVAQAVAGHLGGARFDAVAGRGGLLRPLPGGVYAVDQSMLDDLAQARFGEHPCNLGAPLAQEFAAESGCPAFVVDPPVTDELRAVARLTGLPRIQRRSVFHALSQRSAGRRAAADLGLRYEDAKLVVAHLGGGVSVGAHDRGRIVDVTNGVDGEGPMSAERAGTLPSLAVLELVRRGENPAALCRELLTASGLFAHAGTNDLRVIETRARAGDRNAAALVQTLAYQVAKAVAAMAAALFEDDTAPLAGVVLTGGMIRSALLADAITRRVSWLAPVVLLPEVEEMRALATGALAALADLAHVRRYAQGEG